MTDILILVPAKRKQAIESLRRCETETSRRPESCVILSDEARWRFGKQSRNAEREKNALSAIEEFIDSRSYSLDV